MIKILGREYKVEFVEDKIITDYNGAVSHPRQTIQINNVLSAEKINEVALHEIIHVIDTDLGLKLKESQVRRLSAVLYATLKENEVVLNFFAER